MKNKKTWQILYCDALMKLCPITDFIESCKPRHQMKILRFLELLEELGPSLTRPYADLLHDGVHELRVTLSGEHVRFLYFFCFEEFIILYHAFWKHTDKVPERLIHETVRYRDSLLKRLDKTSLKKYTYAKLSTLSV
jgi:phage-related protein